MTLGGPPSSSSASWSSRRGDVKRAALALFALAALGAHVLEIARTIRDFLESDRAPELDEEALRRELREIGGLAPDTVETILAAARAPVA